MTDKQCTRCKQTFPATTEYFVRDRRLKSGLGSRCVVCARESTARRRAENPEKVREEGRRSGARWREKHLEVAQERGRESSLRSRNKHLEKAREQERASAARRRAADPEKARERDRKSTARRKAKDPEGFKAAQRASNARRKAKDPEKVREQQRVSQAQRKAKDPEGFKAAQRDTTARWKAKDPEGFKEVVRLSTARRNARKQALPDTLTRDEWQNALAWWDGCAYCGLQSDSLTLDHVIPLSSAECPGTTADNCIPACPNCNTSKSASPVREWLERKFGLTHAANRLAIIAVYFSILG